jgi:ribosomal protein L40E
LSFVEHPCHRCGAPISEGAPFCSQCGAPQIRVATPDAEPATIPLPPGTPDNIQPPAEPVRLSFDRVHTVDWRLAKRKVLTIGIVAGLIAFVLPLNGFGAVFWTALGSFIAVRQYSLTPGTSLTSGLGARLGALAGTAAFLTWTALFALALAAFHQGQQLHEVVTKSMQETATRYPSPQTTQVMDFISSPAGFALFITFSVVIYLVLSVACGALAGALSGTLFGKDRH